MDEREKERRMNGWMNASHRWQTETEKTRYYTRLEQQQQQQQLNK